MEVKHHSAEDTVSLTLTEAAKQHLIAKILVQKGVIGVRFSIKKTGCSGLSYVVDYVDSVKEDDMMLRFADTLQVFIDRQSYPFLKGMNVDYVREGMGAKLVFSNPNQKGQCGCGESFIV
jgi:iron-sulfur cluster assembly accessory protein